MFYALIFSLLALVLIVAAASTMVRRRRALAREEAEMDGTDPLHPDYD